MSSAIQKQIIIILAFWLAYTRSASIESLERQKDNTYNSIIKACNRAMRALKGIQNPVQQEALKKLEDLKNNIRIHHRAEVNNGTRRDGEDILNSDELTYQASSILKILRTGELEPSRRAVLQFYEKKDTPLGEIKKEKCIRRISNSIKEEKRIYPCCMNCCEYSALGC